MGRIITHVVVSHMAEITDAQIISKLVLSSVLLLQIVCFVFCTCFHMETADVRFSIYVCTFLSGVMLFFIYVLFYALHS